MSPKWASSEPNNTAHDLYEMQNDLLVRTGGLFLDTLSLRTVEFQVTTFHTHENLYCEAGTDVDATICAEPRYCMKRPRFTQRAITFRADSDILDCTAQTRHVQYQIFRSLINMAIQQELYDIKRQLAAREWVNTFYVVQPTSTSSSLPQFTEKTQCSGH